MLWASSFDTFDDFDKLDLIVVFSKSTRFKWYIIFVCRISIIEVRSVNAKTMVYAVILKCTEIFRLDCETFCNVFLPQLQSVYFWYVSISWRKVEVVCIIFMAIC